MSSKLRRLDVRDYMPIHVCDINYIFGRLLANCDHLEELCTQCDPLTPATLAAAMKYETILRTLDLWWCKKAGFNWCTFLPFFENLEKLRLNFCVDVNDELMDVLARDCP